MVPPPSPKVIYFDLNRPVEPHFPSYVPFQIIVEVFSKDIHQSIIDEWVYIIILSSMSWYVLGSPNLISDTCQLLAFNKRTSEHLGILL